MNKIKVRALILRAVRFEERHQIVTLLTESHGILTALAHNSIQSRRFAGALETLVASECQLTIRDNSDMVRLDDALLLRSFENVRKDFERLSTASLMSEFVVRLSPPAQISLELFKLLSNALAILDEQPQGDDAFTMKVINVFFARILQWSGHQPLFKECFVCQKRITQVETPRILCSIPLAAWSCLECHIENRKEISRIAFEDLIVSLGFSLKQALRLLQGSNDHHKELFEFLKGVCFFHIPGFDQKPFSSLRFVEEFNLRVSSIPPRA